MRRVAADLAERGVTPREREVAVGYLDGAAQLSLEDAGSVMARLGNHVCARGTVIPIEEQLERLRAVTVDDIDRVAAQHLAGDPVLCVVGPLDDIGL